MFILIAVYLRELDSVSREATLSKWFCLPSEKEPTLKGKNSFPFRVDPFLEGTWYAGKQTASHKSCLLCKMGQKSYQVYQVSLNFMRL